MKRNKLQLIFAWRLTLEKWFDLVLWLCDDLQKHWIPDIHIHIFGKWVLKDKIPQHDFVTYHWHQLKEKVFQVRKTCQYSLMPSRFLETFGLSALDSLSLWVPVIGYKKWGLTQFGDGIIDIERDSLYTIITERKQHTQTEYDILSKKCKTISQQYTRDAWKQQFEELLWKPIQWSKILLLSDYINNMWGIETYIESVSDKLKECGAIQVSRIWSIWSKKWWLRYLNLTLSVYHIPLIREIKKHIKKNNDYDLIWRHSTQRALWPVPIHWIGKNTKSTQWVMMHDFGLYHPLPSQIYSEQQIIDSKNFWQRMEVGFKRFWWSIIKKILRSVPLFLKFISSWWIKRELEKSIDLFITPSTYLNTHLQQQYIKEIAIKTLSHVI